MRLTRVPDSAIPSYRAIIPAALDKEKEKWNIV